MDGPLGASKNIGDTGVGAEIFELEPFRERRQF
jgi:hypothetical protein